MSELSDRMHEEVEELRGLRDDLKLQVHLARMEVQQRFQKAEQGWEQLEGKLRQIRDESNESASEIREAAKLLLDEIREGYRHVRDAL